MARCYIGRMFYRFTPPLAVALAALPLTGCVNDVSFRSADAGIDGQIPGLCAPTGRSLIATGVYIAPEACTDVTLYALDAASRNDSWVLHVAWPLYGEYHALEVTNDTTGDVEREVIFTGDPEFSLFSGNYVLGGLEVAAGANALRFVVYNTVENADGTYTRQIYREGSFVLHVTLSSSVGL